MSLSLLESVINVVRSSFQVVNGFRCQVPGAGCKVLPNLFPLSVCCCFCCCNCVAKQNKLTRTGRQLQRGLTAAVAAVTAKQFFIPCFECLKKARQDTQSLRIIHLERQPTSFLTRGVLICLLYITFIPPKNLNVLFKIKNRLKEKKKKTKSQVLSL